MDASPGAANDRELFSLGVKGSASPNTLKDSKWTDDHRICRALEKNGAEKKPADQTHEQKQSQCKKDRQARRPEVSESGGKGTA
jgi:hypothetical protein